MWCEIMSEKILTLSLVMLGVRNEWVYSLSRGTNQKELYYFLYCTRLDLLQVQLQTFTVENFHFEDFCEQHDYKQAMR